MTDFYAKFRALPQRFVDMGALVPITLTRSTASFDPKLMRKTGNATETITGKGFLPKPVETTDANGAIVLTATAKLTVEPKIGDTLVIEDQEHKVIGVAAMMPDGKAFFWTAILS